MKKSLTAVILVFFMLLLSFLVSCTGGGELQLDKEYQSELEELLSNPVQGGIWVPPDLSLPECKHSSSSYGYDLESHYEICSSCKIRRGEDEPHSDEPSRKNYGITTIDGKPFIYEEHICICGFITDTVYYPFEDGNITDDIHK